MKRKIASLTITAGALALSLLAASCGGSSGDSTAAGPYGSGGQPASTMPAAGAATVGTTDSQLGRILSDARDRTLYLFEKDTAGRSACAGACATAWPPLLTDGEVVAESGVDQSLLGTTRRDDGTTQVTYAGHPLYLFVQDAEAGETNGQGSQSFGAGWYVVSPAGEEIVASAGY